jgi:hypothetical protein
LTATPLEPYSLIPDPGSYEDVVVNRTWWYWVAREVEIDAGIYGRDEGVVADLEVITLVRLDKILVVAMIDARPDCVLERASLNRRSIPSRRRQNRSLPEDSRMRSMMQLRINTGQRSMSRQRLAGSRHHREYRAASKCQ